MQYKSSKRASLLGLGALLSIASAWWAAPASATEQSLRTFRVDPFERVIIPRDDDAYLGRTIRLPLDGSEVVRVPLGYRYVSTILDGVEATVGGLPQSIGAGEVFTRRKASGGRLSELPADAVILCRAPVPQTFAQELAAAATLGLAQLAGNYAQETQLCAVDGDHDGRIEKLFLGGAKRQRDLEFTSINPVAYEHAENSPVNGFAFVLYATTGLFGGDPLLFAAIEQEGHITNVSTFRFEANGKMVNQKRAFSVKPRNLPQEIKIGASVLRIKGYDPAAQAVDVEFTKFFETQKLDWYIEHTIYILY
ncbi:hypothetical protein BH11PSE1_BH11PSE1_20580 [soil metagenome]